jgi:glycolate oxidase iron-sulfur subunit
VQYGNLVEIGRRIVDERVPRPAGEQMLRTALKTGLTSPLFKPALKAGQLVRSLLPGVLKAKVPPPAPAGAHRWPQRVHPRKVLLLLGCVQPAMAPNINSATARVLDAAGIQTLVAEDAGCCGAIHLHGGDHEGALDYMRRNIDAWWPLVSTGGVEAIVMNASGCGVTVKEYGHSLRHDPAYADKANRIADLTRDLPNCSRPRAHSRKLSAGRSGPCLAFHSPCSLQHGKGARRVETIPRPRLRCPSAERGAPVLRLGRNLLGAPSRAGDAAARPQARPPHRARAASDRLGQHRLHPAPAERHAACRSPLGGGGG